MTPTIKSVYLKRLTDAFPIQNSVKQRHALLPLLLNFVLLIEYVIKKFQSGDWN
jgi:hypothetical protein